MAASHEQTAPLFDKEQIRTVIKFNALLNRAAIDIHTEIVQVVGEEHSPDISIVRRWVRTFQGNRRVSVEDMPRSGRPRSSTTQTVVDKVQKLIEEDRRITVEEVSYEIGISVGSAYQILTEKLNKTKKSARWVQHILTDEEKRQRNSISQKHLRRHRIEKTDFIDRIVAADETWARSFEPELKRQSAQWRSPTSPRPQKAIRGYAKQKVMHLVFYTSKKVLCNYAVPPKTTVTAKLYRWVLIHKLRPAIAKKQPELLRKGPILLHDGARPHIADVVKEQLMDWGWEVLDHPPYSPDISPCDFHLFPLMKEPLRGIRFESVEDINDAVFHGLQELKKKGLNGGIPNLPQRWQSVVDHKGEYFEGSK